MNAYLELHKRTSASLPRKTPENAMLISVAEIVSVEPGGPLPTSNVTFESFGARVTTTRSEHEVVETVEEIAKALRVVLGAGH